MSHQPSLRLKRCWMLVILTAFTLVAKGQYYYIPHVHAGQNPGGLNTHDEAEYGVALPLSWTAIHTGPAATPAWTPVQQLPFIFLFNGGPVTQYKVSTGGVLTFSTTASAVPPYGAVSLPDASIPDSSICILGIQATGSNDAIVTNTFGAAPNRQHWIQFNQFTSANGTYTYWSIVLEESSNKIYIVDQRHASAAPVAAGVQMNSSMAEVILDSPVLTPLAGDDQNPADNTYYEFIPASRPPVQARLLTITNDQHVLIPGQSTISGELLNIGADTIHSIDIKYRYNGNTYTFPLSNLSLPTCKSTTFTHPVPAAVTTASTFEVTTWIELSGDSDPADDSVHTTITGYSFQTTKRVLLEEGTGTWCGWCPLGMVYTEQLDTLYSDQLVIVSVHNNDIMTDHYYDSAMIANGHYNALPQAAVDRKFQKVAPELFEEKIQQQLQEVSPADISLTASFNPTTRQVSVDVSAEFATEVSGDLRLNAALVEENLHSTNAAYDQGNYFSFQSNNLPLTGAGHNWQTEPDPVPGASMTYQFVARQLLAAFHGQAGSLPPLCQANGVYTYTFSTILPVSYNAARTRVVALLQDANSGHILNTLRGAYGITTAITDVISSSFSMSLYPNPATDFTQVEINMVQPGRYTVEVFDMPGRSMYKQSFNGMNGKNILPVSTRNMEPGIYMVRTIVNGESHTQRLMVK